MNEATTDQNQTDEDILTDTVSDEALEAAAPTKGDKTLSYLQSCLYPC